MRKVKIVSVLLLCLTLLGVGYGFVRAAGPWHGTWADSPDYGYQNWHNYSTYVKWVPVFRWYDVSELHSHSTRRIELEWYDPGGDNYCNRLKPYSLTEGGGDWVGNYWTSNECGGWFSVDERLTFNVNEQTVSANQYYWVYAYADKNIPNPGSSGETNVTWTCWGCGDDWCGKQNYDASYNDTGSDP